MDRRLFLGAIASLTAWAGGTRLASGTALEADLDRHPEEAGRLNARLAADLRAAGCDPLRADTAALRAALARRIQADFDSARVVPVQGWLLSATEARLCGLAATIL